MFLTNSTIQDPLALSYEQDYSTVASLFLATEKIGGRLCSRIPFPCHLSDQKLTLWPETIFQLIVRTNLPYKVADAEPPTSETNEGLPEATTSQWKTP